MLPEAKVNDTALCGRHVHGDLCHRGGRTEHVVS